MNIFENICNCTVIKKISFFIISFTTVLCISYDKVLFDVRKYIPFSAYDELFLLRLFFIIALYFGINICYEIIRDDKIIILFAPIYACIFLVGDSLYKYENLSQIGEGSSPIQLIFSALFGLYYRTVIISIILCALVKVLDIFAECDYCNNDNNCERNPLRNCIIFLIICWIPYYFWLKPGIVAFDEVTMLMHFFDIDGWGAHPTGSPMFTELLLSIPVYIFHQFGNDTLGIFVCSTIQYIICICVLSFSLWTLNYYHCNRIVLYVVTFIYAFVPVFPMYAMSLCKDTIFSCSILLLVLCVTILVKSPQLFYSSLRLKTLFSLSLVFCALTRNGAIALVAVPCVIYMIRHNNRWKSFVRVCISPIIFIAIFSILTNYLWGTTSYNPFLSIMYQQTALYTIKYGDERSEEDINKIDRILEYDKLAESYNPNLSDNVRMLERAHKNENDINAYKQIWIDEGIKHPLTYIEAFTHNNYLYYYPFGYSEWNKLRTNTSFKRVEGVLDIKIDNASSIQINILENLLKRTPLLGLMLSCGFYSCLFLFTILLKMRRQIPLINSIPIFLVYISCLFLPANGNFRYILTIVLCTPYYLGECFLYGNKYRRK